MFGRFLLVALAMIWGVTQPAQAQKWSKAESKHFVVYSDGSLKQLEKAATDLERLDALMRQLLRVPKEENPYRLDVYLVHDQDRVSTLIGDKERRVAGFYRPTENGTFIVAHRGRADVDTISSQVVLFHEYAHHLMFRYFTNAYPAWYREGFAEFLSTTEFDDESFTIGAPADHRAYSIRSGDYMPIQELLSPPENKSKRNEYMFYPQSWVLTHYLLSDSDRNKSMAQYFARLESGEDVLKAAEASFGDLDKLDKEIKKYGRGKINYRKSPNPIAIDGVVTVKALDELESDLAEAHFYNRVGHQERRTTKRMRALAAIHPNNAEVWTRLAEAEWALAHKNDTLDFTNAISAVDKALSISPAAEHPNILKARILIEPIDHKSLDNSTVDWKSVRAHSLKANKANADNPLALLTYMESFRHEGLPMPDSAIPALEQVFGTIPEVTSVRVTLARLYASKGQFDRALELVSFLVADPHAGDKGRELVKEIIDMRDAAGSEPTAEGLET